MPAFGRSLGFGTPPALQQQMYAGQTLLNYGNAQNAQLALTRQQFSDYMTTFAPLEDKYFEYATDPTQAATAMNQAKQDVAGAFQRQSGAIERRLRPLGGLNADEQLAANRSLALSTAAASAGAQNRARDLTLQRQQAILGGVR